MPRVQISDLHIRIVGTSEGLATAVRSAGRLVSSLDGRRREVDGLSSSFRGLLSVVSQTIALFGAFSVGRLAVGQVFDGVKLAADAELAEISLETLLGSAEDAREVLSELYDFVETTPFRLADVRDSAQLLAAFGVETKRILPTLRTLGDISAGINQPVRELADLYGRTLNEQRLYTRDLNQFTSRGIPLIQEFAKTFGVLESEVRDLAEAGVLTADDVTDALARMTAEGGRFFELTKRQAETLVGEFSNLQDEIDGLKREFGTGLNPVLRDFTAIVRQSIAGVDDGEASLKRFRQLGEDLADGLRVLAAGVRGLQIALVSLDIWAARVGQSIETLIRAINRPVTPAFFPTFIEDLQEQRRELIENTRRLLDFERSLVESRSSGEDVGESLAESIGQVPLAVRRAQNELKRLTQSATADAEKLARQFRTPLERFQDAAERIARAQIFGGLERDAAFRAINAEIEKLTRAREALEAVRETGALVRGTREEFEARNQRFRRRSGDSGELPFDAGALGRIFNGTTRRIQIERNDLQQRSEGVREQRINANLERQLSHQQRAEAARREQINSLIRLVERLVNRPITFLEEVGA